jgi:uncharacterized protein (TIGR00297 family)
MPDAAAARVGLTLDQIEDRRQIEHMAFILVAVLLPYINFLGLLLLGAFGLLYAFYLSPHWVRVTTRPDERGTVSRAKLCYALASLCALVVFWRTPCVGPGAFAILAIGDALSNLVGRKFGGYRFPYNPKKTLAGSAAFVLGGGLAAWAVMLWNRPPDSAYSVTQLLFFAMAAALLAGLVESLPPVIDDNITVIWTACLALYLLVSLDPSHYHPATGLAVAVALNAALGVVALLLGWMKVSGALSATVVGIVVLVGVGWPGYLAGLGFVGLSMLCTRCGLRAKRNRGIAEDAQGRGFWSVAAKGAVPTALAACYAIDPSPWLAVGCVSAFATAAFDTVASEIGKWLSPTSRDPRTFRKQPAGAPGGVSWPGTAAGLIAAAVVALAPIVLGWIPVRSLFVVCSAALAGSFFESLLKAGTSAPNEPERAAFNLYCVMLGACLGGGAWLLL